MAITNGYCTLDELKGYLDQGGQVTLGSGNDTEMEAAVTAASRMIDGHCNRRFYDDGEVSARVYAAEHPAIVKVDDFSTTTGLVVATDTTADGTFDRTWAAADYQVEPLNGVVEGIAGWPYWRIRSIDTETFPVARQARVQVTARWGWATVPAAIKQACLIQAAYIWRRKDAITGILGATDFGSVTVRAGLDRDAELLLAPYRRGDIVVPVG